MKKRRQHDDDLPAPETNRWAWGAELFARRGGFMSYSTSFAVRIHSTNLELMQQLVSAFGGKVSGVAGTLQWRLAGEEMRSFLQGIRPLLSKLTQRYGAEPLELVDDALAHLAEPKVTERRGREALTKVKKRHAAAKRLQQSAAAPPPSFRKDGEETFGHVPSPPWDADQVLFELARSAVFAESGMLLEAESAEQASAFAAAAQRVGLDAESNEMLVRLRARKLVTGVRRN